MHRVAITGMGLVSCIGNSRQDVVHALRTQRSGICYVPEYETLGMRSCVAGAPDISSAPPVDRKIRRFMGDAALYAYHAMRDAVDDAGLTESQLRSPSTGLIVGSGVGSPHEHMAALEVLRERGFAKMAPYTVPRVMGNTTSAVLSTAFGIQGFSYSMVSACATSAHCLGHAADLIRSGRQDVVIAGGAEELQWTSSVLFDAMGALSTAFNDATASRPYDKHRDGFVIAGGAGILVLEALDHALARGATIYGELAGYGASSDGMDMVMPSAEGAMRAMRMALDDAGNPPVDYINTHATSTPVGDVSELKAIRLAFGDKMPLISSTKGLTGHPIAASAAHEAIYGLLMMQHGFLAGCAHLNDPDPEIEGFPILREPQEFQADYIMSNSFGFGGTNASLIFKRWTN